MLIIKKVFFIIYHSSIKMSITNAVPLNGKDAITRIAAAVPAVVILIPRVGMDKPAATPPQYAAATSNVNPMAFNVFDAFSEVENLSTTKFPTALPAGISQK